MRGGRLCEVVTHGGSTAAYEINAQECKNILGLEGAGGGGGSAFKNCYCQAGGGGGGGTIFICNFFLGGGLKS